MKRWYLIPLSDYMIVARAASRGDIDKKALMNKRQNDQRRPLDIEDCLVKTLGCRHSNPNICKNNSTPNKCAFVRGDNICLMPPMSWRKIFAELSDA